MRRLVPLCLIATSLLAACGGSGTPDAGVDAGIDLEAYFGLQKDRCFEYAAGDTAKAVPDLGIAVEEIIDVPYKAHVIYYRQGGLAMKDYVGLEGDELKLYKREFPGVKAILYTPPLTWMQAPVRAGAVLQSTGTAAIRDGMGNLTGTEDQTLRIDIFDAVPLTLPIGETVTAHPMTYTLTPATGRHEVRTFAPGSGNPADVDGFVKIDFNFSADDGAPSVTYKLQGLRQLDGTIPCGMAP